MKEEFITPTAYENTPSQNANQIESDVSALTENPGSAAREFKECNNGNEIPQIFTMLRRNVIDHVFDRERGHGQGRSFVSKIENLKVKQLSVLNFYTLSDSEYHVTNCRLLRPCRDGRSVIGLWSGGEVDLMYRIEFKFPSLCSKRDEESPVFLRGIKKIGPFHSRPHIKDICELYFMRQECVLYVGSYYNSIEQRLEGCFQLFSFTNRYFINSQQRPTKNDILCCAGSSQDSVFAIGTKRDCFVFLNNRTVKNAKYPGKVNSIEFNQTGELLYCGINKPGLAMLDLRENRPCHRIRVANLNPGITETKLLSDERIMIVSGRNGDLSQVDLRENRTVLKYPGHVSTRERCCFDLSEKFNVLCATGTDNRTRIWSLNTGERLRTIEPCIPSPNMHSSKFWNLRPTAEELHEMSTVPMYKAHSYLICNENRWGVGLFQKDRLYTLELGF